MLVQDLEGVRSSLSNFFRTISPKPRSNHQRSIWIILPQSSEKNTTFCTIFSWNTSKEGHTCLRGLCYERKLQKSTNVLLYKKWKKTSTNTASCRIWIMLRQILWKSVTGKQRNGEMFWKTVTNDQCFFGNNKIASWSKGFFERFSAILVTWSSHQSAPTYYVGASSTPF